MTFAASLIPGLDEFVKHGDPKRRAEAARRIAELFLLGAANFRPDHVDLFDGVLIDLVPHTELAARADLAERLSLLANAPRALVLLRLGPSRVPAPAHIEGARVNFGRLMPSTAERVVTFWRPHQSA
jgi:uncharacterized protein (DUF2336 family)